ncbi:ABC transporter substrate-binding protein [Nocardioides jejuensis]|uniref:ABC transporter family substrate-binding protein n=1 Tax=Nocardioides jejuensis TaxID=2502782 RepID=A0A4R1BXB5_9ACTN|nr:ABC transporter substrate-binding protein [Nocardioides jejuensis]TCJ22277.1 ABC transporter family substrate-binding protein [Nocardioides jejuensis]
MNLGRKIIPIIAVTATAASLAACGGVTKSETSSGPSSLTVGWNQSFYSINDQTGTGNNVTNANISYLTNSQFNYFDADNQLQKDTSFGTYEKVSDDPLTVKYTLADTAKWSDGVPVTAADLIFGFGANSGNFNTVSDDDVKTDENTGAKTPPKGEAYFNAAAAGANGFQYISKFPTISDDGKSVTLVYDKPFADWEVDFYNALRTPAHVMASEALGIKDATKGNEAVIKAFQTKDKAALAKLADFWNSGFDFGNTPSDKQLLVGSGPYVISKAKQDQYVTVTKNPNYAGEHKGKVDQITVKFFPDATQALQALKNGEMSAYEGQATTDSVKDAEAKGLDMHRGLESTYEHIDLTVNNGGPFDPSTYGGDEAKAKLVRQAFLMAYPRQEIMDKIIKPIVPDAKLRTSLTTFNGAPGYDEISAANGSAAYGAGGTDGIAKAKALLKQAGVKNPVVREMYDKTNPRRAAEYALAEAAETAAGFKMVNKGDAQWSNKLGNKSYDAIFFGWNSTTTSVLGSMANYVGKAGSNFQGYDNATVNKAYADLQFTTDQKEQIALLKTIDTEIYKDAVTLPIFEFPGVVFYDGKAIGGLDPAYLSPNMFYGYWNWTAK